MVISNSNNRTRLAVSGLTYDFTFTIDDDTEILVYSITDDVATLLTLTTDYTVSISTITEGGTVTLTGASSADEILMIRNKAYQQTADIPVRSGFNEAVIEGALDNLEMQIQQLKELIDYCVKQSSTVVPVTVTIPEPEDGLALVWDGVSGTMRNAPVDAGAVAEGIADAEAAAVAAAASEVAAEAAQAAAEAAAAGLVGFGNWLAGPFAKNTAYLAATDLIVTASGAFGSATKGAAVIEGLSDASNPPTTRRQYIENTTDGYYAGITFPVKKGHYWKVACTNTINESIQAIPNGS